jgi:hypothetical protein
MSYEKRNRDVYTLRNARLIKRFWNSSMARIVGFPYCNTPLFGRLSGVSVCFRTDGRAL